MLPIIKLKNLWFFISGTIIVVSIAAVAVWGLKFGIDFTGGSVQEIQWNVVRPDSVAVSAIYKDHGVPSVEIQNSGANESFIYFQDIDASKHTEILNALRQKFATSSVAADKVLEEKSFSAIGPSIGAELQQKSLYAIVVVLLAIIVYIAWAFRKVSRPVASWKYGVAAVIALMHDVFIPIGIFSILGHFLGYQIDILFVTALLTVLGFSVHDTIVVFDRIRENLLKRNGEFEDIVNYSVNQTITRSINTSLTVMVVLLCVYFLGGASVHNFILTLIIGVFFGTYSSIFIASPVLVVWHNLAAAKNRIKR
jgi:preprotein translocase subunit SecF